MSQIKIKLERQQNHFFFLTSNKTIVDKTRTVGNRPRHKLGKISYSSRWKAVITG